MVENQLQPLVGFTERHLDFVDAHPVHTAPCTHAVTSALETGEP